MDAYFFLRYLSMCLKIFAPALCLILPIILPLNYNGGKSTRTVGDTTYDIRGLDTLAWSNVAPENTSRYWAHLILAVILVAWVCYVFHQELMHYIVKRQEYLTSSGHRLKASSTTVLVTDIPEELCTSEALEELYGDFPGGVRRMWLNRDFGVLVEKDKERRHFEDLLENAETNLIRKVANQHRKQQKVATKAASMSSPSPLTKEQDSQPSDIELNTTISENQSHSLGDSIHEMLPNQACERCLQYDLETKAAWTKHLTPKQRPTMRIHKQNRSWASYIPIMSRFFTIRVDTIYHCRRELARLNKEIETEGQVLESYKQNGSAFIQFNSQKPADINWPSLNLSWRARYLHRTAFLFLFLLALVLFGVISFFTGILSKASTFGDSVHWLRWIQDLPQWLLSFIQGTLPPVIQVILLSGPLPIILRAMTNKTRGALTGSEGERSLQLWYFIFLLVELFLIPTLSSGLTATIQALIESPASVPNILATNLPTAANYYFSFLIVQALSISASSILQTIRLFNFYVLGGTNTPDSVFTKLSFTNRTRIGSNIPWYTTFAVIGMFSDRVFTTQRLTLTRTCILGHRATDFDFHAHHLQPLLGRHQK
jgi:hypothetical protein